MNKTLDEIKVGDRFFDDEELIQTREIKVYTVLKVYGEDFTLDAKGFVNLLVEDSGHKPIMRLYEDSRATFIDEDANLEQIAYDVLRKHTLETVSNGADTLLAEIRKLPDDFLSNDHEMMDIFTGLASAYGYSTDILEHL